MIVFEMNTKNSIKFIRKITRQEYLIEMIFSHLVIDKILNKKQAWPNLEIILGIKEHGESNNEMCMGILGHFYN